LSNWAIKFIETVIDVGTDSVEQVAARVDGQWWYGEHWSIVEV
jgi:hypothetical protein